MAILVREMGAKMTDFDLETRPEQNLRTPKWTPTGFERIRKNSARILLNSSQIQSYYHLSMKCAFDSQLLH